MNFVGLNAGQEEKKKGSNVKENRLKKSEGTIEDIGQEMET